MTINIKTIAGNKVPQTTSNDIPPLVLTKEMEVKDDTLSEALEKLAEAQKKLLANMDELHENIKKLTEENQRLKDALGIVESNPFKDLEGIFNGK
jgi:predicted transcriptional regulator|tara:strand:- start:68 stop:352 length:285 start_codon:yes stop_codon:yes gene_type:complete